MKGGMIGCGYFGQIQLEAWGRMPEVEIVAAADPDTSRGRSFAPRAYASAEEMLEKEQLDFIDIATRPEHHLHLVKLAASHRIPAICQKPMARDVPEALEMVQVAENAGIRLMIHENWRWQPWHRVVKRFLQDNGLGQPLAYFFRSRKNDGRGPSPYSTQPYFRDMPKLIIYESLVHQIDTARFLFGDIRSVFARTARFNPEIVGEDRATVVLAHDSILQGVVDVHRFLSPVPDGPAMGATWIEGDRGALSIQATGDIFFNGELFWSAPQLPGYKGDSVRATQQHFIACLKSGVEFETSGRDYLKTFVPTEAAYESAAAGREIAV
jgi:predicted dehydrogenase